MIFTTDQHGRFDPRTVTRGMLRAELAHALRKRAMTAAGRPVYRLRNLRIDRVDLVDLGACLDPETGEGARILLTKRASPTSPRRRRASLTRAVARRVAARIRGATQKRADPTRDALAAVLTAAVATGATSGPEFEQRWTQYAGLVSAGRA